MKIKYKFLFYTAISFFLTVVNISCKNKKEAIPDDRYQWEAGFCAPKYYPVGGAKVDFGNASCSSLTNFDNGWGFPYGAVSSAEKYKKLPRTLTVDYASAVENLVYEGTVILPYQKIEKLFKEYIKDKETDRGSLLVGLAPGGWIRVWAYFSTRNLEIGVNTKIEILKTQVKGHEDSTMGEGFTNKNSKYWSKYNYYWNHFGIPLEVWADNEKEYNLFFNFYNPNPDYEVGYQYSSLDGTLGGGSELTGTMKQKLPTDLVINWANKKDTIGYQAHLLMPKNFSKIVESKKTKNVEILLKIEKNDEYGILYLITNNKKEKILRFKNLYTSNDVGLGECDFTKDVEYFIK